MNTTSVFLVVGVSNSDKLLVQHLQASKRYRGIHKEDYFKKGSGYVERKSHI